MANGICRVLITLTWVITTLSISLSAENQRYLLYSVFHGEGFNLRRDVYIRMANVVRLLQDPLLASVWNSKPTWPAANWTLVLPPWSAVPHWKSLRDGPVSGKSYRHYPAWSHFFDIPSLSRVIPVMELDEFQRDVLKLTATSQSASIDLALKLTREQSPTNTVITSSNRDQDVHFCSESTRKAYRSEPPETNRLLNDGAFSPLFFLSPTGNLTLKMTIQRSDCISGDLEVRWLAAFLANLTQSRFKAVQTVYLDSAETAFNGFWSEWSQEYWTIRRSMVFSAHLRRLGDEFRGRQLNSTDLADRTLAPSTWLQTSWPLAPAIGGPYLAVHWRRGDFVLDERTPSARLAAEQIVGLLRRRSTDLRTVFLATDASDSEISDLTSHLRPLRVVRYQEADVTHHEYLGDGEMAIIDQWICAHARIFIGTNPSTFSFRIAEERSIMGFPAWTTFNTLCPVGGAAKLHGDATAGNEDDDSFCEAMTSWPVVVESAFSTRAAPAETQGSRHAEL